MIQVELFKIESFKSRITTVKREIEDVSNNVQESQMDKLLIDSMKWISPKEMQIITLQSSITSLNEEIMEAKAKIISYGEELAELREISGTREKVSAP